MSFLNNAHLLVWEFLTSESKIFYITCIAVISAKINTGQACIIMHVITWPTIIMIIMIVCSIIPGASPWPADGELGLSLLSTLIARCIS